MAEKTATVEVSPLARCIPLGVNVVILRDEPQRQSAGGILLPDAKIGFRPSFGVVVSVGPDVKSSLVKPGVRVAIKPYSGQEVAGTVRDDRYAVVKEDDVLAAID